MYKLDLTSFSDAINSLEQGLKQYSLDISNKLLRDGCIQRYEYTYELTYKMLKRYLEGTEPISQEIDNLSFPGLIRLAFERGLVKNSWDKWSDYRESRNISSHTYNDKKAQDVFNQIPNFLDEAKYCYNKLNELV